MRAIVSSALFAGFTLAACGGGNGGGSPTSPDGGGGVLPDGAVAPPVDSGVVVPNNPDGGAVVVTGSSPVIGGCAVLPADNPWNTRIDDATKYPAITTYAAKMAPTTKVHPDWGDWSTDHYGIPWELVPATQPAVPVTFTQSADQSDPGPYPIPPTALIEGGAGSGGDMHVLVIQSGSCNLYETYSTSLAGSAWSAASGAKFPLGSDALRTDGWTSADAAGLPILPGLVKVSEVNAGAIKHAIRFTMNNTQQAYIHPATHAAGKADATLPPMGLRLRLKASFDTSKLTGASLVVATAMQQYGLILADNGSDWYISGDSDDAWTPLMDGLVTQLGTIHGSDFEAVQTGALSTAGR